MCVSALTRVTVEEAVLREEASSLCEEDVRRSAAMDCTDALGQRECLSVSLGICHQIGVFHSQRLTYCCLKTEHRQGVEVRI